MAQVAGIDSLVGSPLAVSAPEAITIGVPLRWLLQWSVPQIWQTPNWVGVIDNYRMWS